MSVSPLRCGSGGRSDDTAYQGAILGSSSARLTTLIAVIFIVAAILRVWAGAGQPLWLDEAWTGIHALQPTFGDFIREVYVDINAPLYYGLMWGWAALFGVSNEALRAPSLAFGLLAPLLALMPSREIDRATRLIWCVLLATWMPGLLQSQEARCYTMLLALCTGGIVLHARLIGRPTLALASAWASIGTLAILTHYYAAILFGCQGLAYLAYHRGRALRTWPAGLIYLLAFGWMAYHLPQLATFAETNWFSALHISALPWIALYALGPGAVGLLLMSPGIRNSVLGIPLGGPRNRSAVLPWVVGPAIAGAAILIAAGFLRPSFTQRYLTIFVPGLLLALAAWAAAIGRTRPWAPPVYLGISLGWAFLWATTTGAAPARIFNFETASEYLMSEGADTVVFTWDNPSAQLLPARKMGELGSFFFRRASSPLLTTGLPLPGDKDPNRVLLETATGERPGILWIYDRNVPGTLALSHPPSIETLDLSWRCRDFGRDAVGVLACIRSEPKPPAA
jgi:hypothetical protein